MAYSEILAERVSRYLAKTPKVETRKMMGGLVFMVDAKMCVGITGEDLMVRIDPETREAVLRKKSCREMAFTGRTMKGFVLVGPAGTKADKDLAVWMEVALDFNKLAKASKKRKSRPVIPPGRPAPETRKK